jgi:hypothetical protein
MVRSWKVRVIGPVSWQEGNRPRKLVPTGDYDMREVGVEGCRLSRDDGSTYDLTLTEVGTYVQGGEMKVIEGVWP